MAMLEGGKIFSSFWVRHGGFFGFFLIDTITILVLWRSTITIRLFGKIPLQFLFCHSNIMFYVWDGLGPTCRRTRRLRSSVWAILPSAQVDNVPHGDSVFLLALPLSSRLLPV